ncbi:MAG TPA: MCP four helix bundle domain-containing protein [Saprospiraceae bacterium]|nr:MCP four helix bundle domain-containing protein [Saprospiraceae bacterium]
MSFYNKLKWILAIVLVFVLLVTTKLIDSRHFKKVKDSVVTIYEDRLIADDLIFEMSRSLHEKEIAAMVMDTVFFNSTNKNVNQDIEDYVSRFEQTKLTPKEKTIFDNFKANYLRLRKTEKAFISNGFPSNELVLEDITNIRENLYELTKIQLVEGNRQMSISKEAIEAIDFYGKIEIYFLAFIAFLILILVLFKPKTDMEGL